MSTPYPKALNPVQNGEAVNQAVTNRPVQQLGQRTDSNRELIEHGLYGSSLLAREVATESDAAPGMAVYRDNDGVWRKAVFAMDLSSQGEYGLNATAWVGGVVSAKINATLADVTTLGLLRLTGAELAAVCQSGTAETGQLFLSGTKAGFLTAKQPPSGVQVAHCSGPDADGDYLLLVAPNPRNPAEAHIHYRVPLTMAATNPTVLTPAAGWANTTTYAAWFASNGIVIPAGATYYYLHTADSQLSRLWPPLPLGLVDLERNGVRMRTDGTGATALVNNDGIWYLSATNPPVSSGAVTNLSNVNLVGGYADRIDVLFVRLTGKTGVVTSLTAKDATIEITDPRGQPASVGALQIRAKFTLAPTDVKPGYQAVKDIVGMEMQRGPVVEGLKIQTGSGLAITGGVPVAEAVGDPASGYVGGRLTLGLTDPGVVAEGYLDTIALDNAQLFDNGNGVYGITLPNNLVSAIQGRVRIPKRGVAAGGVQFTLELVALCKANGNPPELVTTLYRQTEPVETCGDTNYLRTLSTTPVTWANIDLGDCGGGAVTATAGQYLKKTSAAVTVFPGDLLFIKLLRNSGDGYNGDVSLLDVRWRLTIA